MVKESHAVRRTVQRGVSRNLPMFPNEDSSQNTVQQHQPGVDSGTVHWSNPDLVSLT